MLAYSLRIRPEGLQPIGGEQFGNHLNVLSKILTHCVNILMKQGIVRNYVPHTNTTTMPHGKILTTASIQKNTLAYNRLICGFDEFDEDTYQNRIIKATLHVLLTCDNVKKEIKKEIKKSYSTMGKIGLINSRTIQWNMIHYSGSNLYYRMALIVSRLIFDGLLPNSEGNNRAKEYLNEGKEWSLFESFIRGYYEIEYPTLSTEGRIINWAIPKIQMNQYVPDMLCDIKLESKTDVLIIDTKWYEHSMNDYYGNSYHSVNLYQIQSYVTNWNYNNINKKASGLLLYAETEQGPINDHKTIAGNHYHILTINLKGKWNWIDYQLRSIAEQYFNQ